MTEYFSHLRQVISMLLFKYLIRNCTPSVHTILKLLRKLLSPFRHLRQKSLFLPYQLNTLAPEIFIEVAEYSYKFSFTSVHRDVRVKIPNHFSRQKCFTKTKCLRRTRTVEFLNDHVRTNVNERLAGGSCASRVIWR